jgi:hypothetical protein
MSETEIERKVHSQYADQKELFTKATLELKSRNITPTLTVLIKFMYSTASYCNEIPTNIKELLLRVVIVSVSEAICESYGSVMEGSHHR